jgi:putative spermidine/putrescine transport system permease protein
MTTLPIEIFSYIQWESSPVISAITTVQDRHDRAVRSRD